MINQKIYIEATVTHPFLFSSSLVEHTQNDHEKELSLEKIDFLKSPGHTGMVGLTGATCGICGNTSSSKLKTLLQE